MNPTALLLALVTLVAGVVIGWLAARARVTGVVFRERAEAARLSMLLEGERAAAAVRAELERVAAAERSGAERVSIAERAETTRLAAAERARVEQERAESQAAAEARLREAFAALAGDALDRNNAAFAELAAAKFASVKVGADGELAQRQQAIEAMVGPLRETLDRVQAQLSTVEKERSGSYSALLSQVTLMRATSEQLQRDTNHLVTALRAPQVRGRWGEMQLERAVEAAGMTEHVDYVTQETASGPDGNVRPDLVVRLVGGKNVVVDSKVAFSGYLEAIEAKDEATRDARLKAHARHLRTHVDQLGAKAYFEHFAPSPEFVVCFVPADAFLDAALREDPSLQEHAFDRNVVLATPSTLVALLRTIAYTWRQEALAANAAEVHQLGRELYQRLSTMGGHIDKLGTSLTGAVANYNKAVSSLESRVFVTARKMVDLKVVEPGDALEAPRQVTDMTRAVQAEEIAAQRLVALPRSHVPTGQGELPTAEPEPGRRTS